MLPLCLSPAGFSAKPKSDSLCSTVEECTSKPLWHLPGPNPIVAPWNPDGKPAWMSQECEVAGGVQKAGDKYYFTYHCLNEPTNSYRIGVSPADKPMGPWTKPPEY